MTKYLSAIFWAISLAVSLPAKNALCGNTQGPRYELAITDRPAEKRFQLKVTSHDRRRICLELRRWPNEIGRVHYGRDWLILHTAEGIYPAIDENFGRCVGSGCTIHIEPLGTLEGFIAYSAFGSEKKIARLTHRRLKMDMNPWVCAPHG